MSRRARPPCEWCLYGAIECAAGGVCWPAVDALEEAIDAPERQDSVGRWNDQRGRTAGEVVALLRRAAERIA